MMSNEEIDVEGAERFHRTLPCDQPQSSLFELVFEPRAKAEDGIGSELFRALFTPREGLVITASGEEGQSGAIHVSVDGRTGVAEVLAVLGLGGRGDAPVMVKSVDAIAEKAGSLKALLIARAVVRRCLRAGAPCIVTADPAWLTDAELRFLAELADGPSGPSEETVTLSA